MTTRTLLRAAVAAVAALALAACGSSGSGSTTSSAPAGPVTASDPWVKTAETGMTAAFMKLTNTTGKDIVLVKAATPAAGMVELHEMAMKDGQMVMQPKEGGIPIKAGASAMLEPGGDHIMLMDIPKPIAAGETVALTLTFDDGTTLSVDAVAKDFDGGNESYEPSPSMSMSGM
ncbi:MAG: copper chaperone PCu(A)C [Actinobacteria bacterium]|jgi:copper(I)-binding protein|nr:copper chaperone PCu(A)C [Actinomycetota bacterium]